MNGELESSRAENDDLVSELNELRYSYAALVDREKLNESALESVYNELDKGNEVERELRELVERSKADCAELVKEVDRREGELQSLQRSFEASLSDKRLVECAV